MPQAPVTGITHSLGAPSLTLTRMVARQVAGAADNCRIAILSPERLFKKAVHMLGHGGHRDAPETGSGTSPLGRLGRIGDFPCIPWTVGRRLAQE